MIEANYEVDAAADLIAFVPPDGTYFVANGLNSRADRGPLDYYYNASSTATPDTSVSAPKGDNVICPTSITPPAPGRYLKSPRDYVQLINKPSLATVATTGSYTDLINTPSARSQSLSSRTINSAAYQVSNSRDALVFYDISISATISLTTGQSGTVQLQMSPTSGGTYTTVGTAALGNTGSLTIGLNLTNSQIGTLCRFIPAGYWIKLVSTGAATMSIVSQQEVLL